MRSLIFCRCVIAGLAIAICLSPLSSADDQRWPNDQRAAARRPVVPAEFTAPVAAETAPPKPLDSALTYKQSPLPEPPNIAAMIGRLFFGTAVALGLCAASLYFGRRWMQGNLAGLPTKNVRLKVVEMINLGPRCAVFLVQANGSQVLCGTDPQGLKSMVVLPEGFDRLLDDRLQPADKKKPENEPSASRRLATKAADVDAVVAFTSGS